MDSGAEAVAIPKYLYSDHLPMFLHFQFRDITTIVAATILFTVARYYVQLQLVQTILRSSWGCHIVPDSTKHLKFSESAWKFTYYMAVFLWALICFCGFSRDSFNMWDTRKGWYEADLPIPCLVKGYYLTQLSFYLHALVAHVTIEIRRRDFLEMLIHHLVTIALVGASYGLGFVRIGLVVFFLHDMNDVFFESGKLLVYSKRCQKLASVSFCGLVILWGSTRLFLFPQRALYGVFFECAQIYGDEIVRKWAIQYWFFNVLLWILAVLDVFWFGLMVKMLLRIVLFRATLVDTRELED